MKCMYWATAVTLTIYLPLATMPAEWLWYDPQRPSFADAVAGDPVPVLFVREIKRSSVIEYSSVLWDADTGDVICDGNGGPFRYRAQSGALVGKDLNWWMGGDCALNLAPGHYWVDTNWTVVRPFADLLPRALDGPLGWILPPKSVSRSSAIFTISAKE